jgi:uncharacterized protein YutE (UPF0331/DUF86 family)
VVLRIDAVRERLAKLEEVVSRLVELAPTSREAFRADYRLQWLAERGLELAAQAIFDIGNHVLAGHFGENARDYEEILTRLVARGVLSPTLGARLRGLGGFRNVLVHGYLTIDPDRVHEGLQRASSDFTDFQAEMMAWVAALPGD